MKNASQCAKKLTALQKRLPKAEPPEFPDADDPVAVLVQSFLLAESTTSRAVTAYRRMRESIVDFNDLRVTMPHEMMSYIGTRYPRAEERCQRLRATLRNIYLREHAVTLERLQGSGKREVKKYLESLEGMTPYVSARVMLLSFDVHAIPVCEHLRSHLVAAGVADENENAAAVVSWLTRQIRASDGMETHLSLQAWLDEHGGRDASGPRKTKTKKTTTSKTRKTGSSKPSGKSTTPRSAKTRA